MNNCSLFPQGKPLEKMRNQALILTAKCEVKVTL